MSPGVIVLPGRREKLTGVRLLELEGSKETKEKKKERKEKKAKKHIREPRTS
jgi:hypothetical protein